MTVAKLKQTAGIVKDEQSVIEVVDDLYQEGFDRHEISTQAEPETLEETFGKKYIKPEILENNPNTPKQNPTMPEDYYWTIAYMVAIPMYVGMILALVVGGIIHQSTMRIINELIIGAIIGGGLGAIVAYRYHRKHTKQINKQLKKGGFVVWVRTMSQKKINKAKEIFKQHHASDIEVQENQINI